MEPTSVIFFRKSYITSLTPQSAIFGFTDALERNYLLVNHLLLIIKCNVYNSMFHNTFSFQTLKCVFSQIKYVQD